MLYTIILQYNFCGKAAAYGFSYRNLRQKTSFQPQFSVVCSYSTYFIIPTGFVNSFLAISCAETEAFSVYSFLPFNP